MKSILLIATFSVIFFSLSAQEIISTGNFGIKKIELNPVNKIFNSDCNFLTYTFVINPIPVQIVKLSKKNIKCVISSSVCAPENISVKIVPGNHVFQTNLIIPLKVVALNFKIKFYVI